MNTSADTEGAAKDVAELNNLEDSAIASKLAAKIYDLPVIQEGIADKINNYTRFLIFSQKTSKLSLFLRYGFPYYAYFHKSHKLII